MQQRYSFLDQAISRQYQAQRWREMVPIHPVDAVHIRKGDRTLLNFSSNDYLGLSKHPEVMAAAQQYTARYGTGATASRLVAGTYDIHAELEAAIATALGREAVILFNSGFQANVSVLATLVNQDSLVVCDRLVHNSIVQGILLSRARFKRYHHNDLNHLEQILKTATQRSDRQAYNRILVISETVFSMDGDRSDVDRLIQLADQYHALLYLDDAHGLGVFGPNGMGLTANKPGVDVVVGTFGKAFGSFGAFVACSRKIRDFLVNFCPGLIYTTALPPGVIGSVMAALTLIPTMDCDRHHLHQMAHQLRSVLQSLEYDTARSTSQIVPFIVGPEAATLSLSQWLEEQGIGAIAIRPPTVSKGTSRIRFALSSLHTTDHVKILETQIARYSNELRQP